MVYMVWLFLKLNMVWLVRLAFQGFFGIVFLMAGMAFYGMAYLGLQL